ncbi:MAG TPA: helix-turn-helix domain-containing protein [Candidatus Saccharimonadales bacterium]|nr:helix-turn-helix domain-containing protein [Candidatus Saccharimonadales bacterium]
MHTQQTIQTFILLRAEGKSFAKIAEALNVSERTLINWSRIHQFEIQNLRIIKADAIQQQCFVPARERWESLAKQLRLVEEELNKRNLEAVPTARLMTLASNLRAEMSNEEDKLHFSQPLEELPEGQDAPPQAVLDWRG